MNHTYPDLHTLIQNWSGSSRIQRDLKRIPDIWVHQWKIISFKDAGDGEEEIHLISSQQQERKKAQISEAIFNSGPSDMKIKKEHEDFASICGGRKTWRCFIGLCETRNCSLKTPLNCSSTALFSHTAAALWFNRSSFTVIPPFHASLCTVIPGMI